MVKKNDLKGQRYGRLIVLEQQTNRKRTSWLCQCDCGNRVVVSSCHLRSGHTQSCGCYCKDRIRESKKKENEYHVIGDITIIKTNNGEEIIIDTSCLEKAKEHCWVVGSHGYACARDDKTGKVITMHRYLMGLEQYSPLVDHVNRNRLDNRQCNLRLCNSEQNAMNKSILKTNTSGITGVNREKNGWRARIGANHKTYELGVFEKFEDAVKARKDAEELMYGEFSPKDVRRL